MARKILDKSRNFCGSLVFSLMLFAFAVIIVLVKGEVWGTLAFVMILSALLVLCDDITVTTLPFLLVCMFVLKCYDSFDTFIVFAPWAVIPLAALLFHFIAYRRKFSIDRSFFGICAVAVAVTAGGAFSISKEEYFSGTSLYYIAGLGIGMVVVYLLLKSQFVPRDTYNIRERLFAIFYIAGFFGFFMVASHYAENLTEILNAGRVDIQWSNNLSTMMMFFMPVSFYYALKKNRFHLLAGILFYITILMTGSRGGLVMGTAEFLLCLIFVSIYDKPLRYTSIITLLVGVLGVVFAFDILKNAFIFSPEAGFISPYEPRYKLIKLAMEDFLSNPIFGRGIGYTGNSEIYNPVKGAANWYHMMIPQIIGSLGIVGILAYGYQLIDRVRLIFQKRTLPRLTIGLCYAGILLMSMINPGEFCPLPYELLTVLLFIFLEMKDEPTAQNAFLPCGINISFKRQEVPVDNGIEWYD